MDTLCSACSSQSSEIDAPEFDNFELLSLSSEIPQINHIPVVIVVVNYFRNVLSARSIYSGEQKFRRSGRNFKTLFATFATLCSLREIGRVVGCSEKAVRNALELYRETGQLRDRVRSGRPRKTDPNMDRVIHRLPLFDRKLTAVDIWRQISMKYGDRLSVQTIKRRLWAAGLYGRIARRKPLVSRKNRLARIEFAKEHMAWTTADWAKVLWSDESKFNRLGSDGRQYVRRRKGEEFSQKCTEMTLKGGGGSVMVWGCFSRSGPGPICRVEGIMRADDYKKILAEHMVPFSEEHMPLTWQFQHDNDPKHKAKKVVEYLLTENISVMKWPAQSPDLNPIENLWNAIDRVIKCQKPSTLHELFDCIQQNWMQLSPEYCAKLVDSMHDRCKAVLKNFGYPTKY